MLNKKIILSIFIIILLSVIIVEARSRDVPITVEYKYRPEVADYTGITAKKITGWDKFLMSIGLFAISPAKEQFSTSEEVIIRTIKLYQWANTECENTDIFVDLYRNGIVESQKITHLGHTYGGISWDTESRWSAGSLDAGTYLAKQFVICRDSFTTICANNGASSTFCTNGDRTISEAEDAFFSVVSPQCTPSPEDCSNGIDDDCDGLADLQDPNCQQPPCTNFCENEAKECVSTTSIKICEKKADGCYDWADPKSCGTGYICKDNLCSQVKKTCYKCIGETLDTKTDQTSCPTGYSTTKPSTCGSTPTDELQPNDWEIFNITLQDEIPPSKNTAIYFCIKNTLDREATSSVEVFYLKKTETLAQQLIDSAGNNLFSVIRTGQADIDSCKVEEYNKAYDITVSANGEACFYADPRTPSITGDYIVAVGAYNKCGIGHTALAVDKNVKISATAIPKTEICDNVLDDDFDGNADADDSDCGGSGDDNKKCNGRWPLTKKEIGDATDAQLRNAQCDFSYECCAREGYEVSCMNADKLGTKIPATTWERTFNWLGLSSKDGICFADKKSDFKLIEWVMDNVGVDRTTAYAVLGIGLLGAIFLLNMIFNPPRK